MARFGGQIKFTSSQNQRLVGAAIVVVTVVAGLAAGEGVHRWRIWALHDTARRLASTGPATARAAYERYLELAPSDHTARLELANLLKRPSAEEALNVLRTIPPAAAEYRIAAREVAVLALQLGRDYDALEPLLYLEELLPDDATFPLALAEIYYRARNLDAAIEQAAKCRQLDPEQVQACLLQAEALDDAKRSAEMSEPLEAALRLDPELPQVHLNLAYAYQLVGRFDEALVEVRWFLARYPDSAGANRLLAQIERGLGRPENALSAVRRSRELQPQNLEAALLEGELLLFLRRADEAYTRLTEIAPRFSAEKRLTALLLRSATLSGRPDEAAGHRARLARLSLSDYTD